MSISLKTDDAPKRKGFMSRVSSVLLSTKTKRRSKSKTSSPPSSVLTRRSSPSIEDRNISNVPPEEQEPGYSTIHDLNLHCIQGEHHDESPLPPPVPKKSMDIYATVEKKGTRLSKTTEHINLHSSKQDQPSCSTAHLLERKTGACRRKELINAHSSQEEEDDVPYMEEKHNTKAAKTEKLISHSRKHHKGHSKHHGHTGHHIPHSVISSQVPIQSSSKFIDPEIVEVRSLTNKITKLKQKHHEELLNLRQEMQHTDQENEVLRAKISDMLEKEHNWQDDLEKSKLHQQEHLYAVESNAELNRRIAKLEIDTQQDVQLLCRQINLIKHEKDELIQRLKTLQEENDSLQKKYVKLQDQQKNMISIERHVKVMEESKSFVEEIKTKYEQDMAKLRTIASKVEDQRNSLSIKVVIMEGEQKRLQEENAELRKQEEECEDKNKALSEQVDHMKTHHAEATVVISSLMRAAEMAIIERDAAIKKTQMQDYQNQLIHTSVIDHSMKVGRLEEHVMNLRRQMDEEVAKVLMSKNDKELDYNNMKESYERQVYFLQEKLLQKNSSLDSVVKEKRQLQLDMEHMWEATLMSQKSVKNDFQLTKFISEKLNNR